MGRNTGNNEVECTECGRISTMEELYDMRDPKTSGKKRLKCPSCSDKIGIEFYCDVCDVWHSCRAALKGYKNGGVTEYVCTECDGWIRTGEVLDVRQGIYQ